MSEPNPGNDLENELMNIGNIADCLAALTVDRIDRNRDVFVKAVDYLGYMLASAPKGGL